MTLPRRQFLHLTAGAAALPVVSRLARAQSYPTRPIRLLVGFAAGGPNDILARIIGAWLSDRIGQQVVVENKPGGAGNIATEMVARAVPDGHTLLIVNIANAVNATLYEKKLNFNFFRDFAPVAGIMRSIYVVEVSPMLPVQTLDELIRYTKANPGKINMASAGSGTPQHIFGELFKAAAGVNMVHVPYRGEAPALTDLIGGQVQMMFGNVASSIEYIRAGRLRALAVTTATRSDLLPDIPTVADVVPGYEASGWFGLGTPRNTPAEIIQKLNTEVNSGLADPKIRARISDLGGTALPVSPAQFGELIAAETEKWGRVFRTGNIKAE